MPEKNELKKKRNRKPDALHVQVRVSVRRGVKVTKKTINDAVMAWAEDGIQHSKDVLVKAILWSNPDRKKPEDRRLKSSDDPGQSLEEARTTLHLRRWLQRRINQFSAVGDGRGNSRSATPSAGLRPAANAKPPRRVGRAANRRTQS